MGCCNLYIFIVQRCCIVTVYVLHSICFVFGICTGQYMCCVWVWLHDNNMCVCTKAIYVFCVSVFERGDICIYINLSCVQNSEGGYGWQLALCQCGFTSHPVLCASGLMYTFLIRNSSIQSPSDDQNVLYIN